MKTLNKGFGALIAVVCIASGLLAFILATYAGIASYAGMVTARESRIQAQLNAKACFSAADIRISEDYFINGDVFIPEFGCSMNVLSSGSVFFIHATSTLNLIQTGGFQSIQINNGSISISSQTLW